ncbi:MAG: TrkA family potassium uptake protein [Caldilinea sp.]
MRFIIVGCGRAGFRLVKVLLAQGHVVTAIDRNREALVDVAHLANVRTVCGVAIDREVLLEAGIQQADGLAAVTGQDEANVVVARLARQIFHVPRVVARVFDPRKADIYRRLGVLTISPVAWGVDRMAEALLSAHVSPLISLGNGDLHLVQVKVMPTLVGRALAALAVPGEIQVTAIQRSGRTFLPGAETVFVTGDVLYLAVTSGALPRLEALFA